VGGVCAKSLDVETEGEAFLRAGEINERGTQDAIDSGVGMIERFNEADEALESLLLLVERDEDGAVTSDEIDVTHKAVRGFRWKDIQIRLGKEALVRVHGPGVALCGEDGRAWGVERTQGLHEGRVSLRFRNLIHVIGILAEIYEMHGWR